MSKQTVYGSLSTQYMGRRISLPVPVGEIESDDGIVYNASINTATTNVKPIKVKKPYFERKSPRRIKNKPKRKLERQNRLKGRR